MAKKGQVFNNYTDAEREQITLEVIDGKENMHSAGRKYNISWKTIETWVRKYKRQGTTLQLKPKGRPKTSHLTEIEKLKLENEILKKFRAFLNQQQEER
jgi:transposase-like protein